MDHAVNQMSMNAVMNLAKMVEHAKMDLTNTFASAGLAMKAGNVREKLMNASLIHANMVEHVIDISILTVAPAHGVLQAEIVK